MLQSSLKHSSRNAHRFYICVHTMHSTIAHKLILLNVLLTAQMILLQQACHITSFFSRKVSPFSEVTATASLKTIFQSL